MPLFPLSNSLQNGQEKKQTFLEFDITLGNFKLTYIPNQLTLISFLTQHLVTHTTVKKIYTLKSGFEMQ